MFNLLPILLGLCASAGTETSGWIVVDLVDNATTSTVDSVQAEGHLVSLEKVELSTEGIYRGFTTDPTSTIAALQNDPRVEIVEPVMEFSTQGEMVKTDFHPSAESVNDPDYNLQWHMKAASSEYAWKHTTSGTGIVVAILDTGFNLTKDFNPDNVLPGHSMVPGEEVADGHGHGTHCASTVAQWTNNGFAVAGLAKNAKILPVKVLSDEGYGYNDWIAGGIDYATEYGADVISMSLGGGSQSSVINAAIDRAIEAGVVVVAASGNDGGPYTSYPASYPPVISIGASGPDGLRSYYSNYNKYLDITAPGGNKQIKNGGVFQWIKFQGKEGLQEWQGTSMATPHAAAAVAILRGQGIAAADVEALLKETATAPAKNPKEYGAGLLNLEAALKEAKGSTVIAGEPPADDGSLPFPNPAGNLTFAILGLSTVTILLLNRVYHWKPSFIALALGVAVATSGPLHALVYLPFHIAGLSVFMVPWLEIPDYLIGQGISGCPLWLSVLPLIVPFLVLTAIPRTRPVMVGLLASTLSYLLVDTATHFNPVWWMTGFGSSCWLGVNAMFTAGLLFVATEVNNTLGDGGNKT